MATLVSQNSVELDARIVNVASVRQVSPFRYPGGKTWLVPTISAWLRRRPKLSRIMVDPFTGGASVPLGMLGEGLVEQIVMGELDPDVSAVWRCIFGPQREKLCRRIRTFPISRSNVVRELDSAPRSEVDHAFQVLLKNRTFRGGILAPGASLMKEGENGHGVASRWYPETLVRRLRALGMLAPAITFVEGDAFPLIRKHLRRRDVVFFIDPPYTAGNGKRAGRRLYKHNELDHPALFETLSRAAGLVLMTYDDCPEVVEMANRYGFQIERIPMKNTHHEKKCELLISNCVQSIPSKHHRL
jgi:DNA adenine methylase